MNKLLYLVLFAIFIQQSPVYAQQVDQRTTTTKIADLLAQQPSLNEQKLNEAMKQMDAFQASDFTALLKTLTPPGQGNNSKLEYATNSYAFYVQQAGKESQRAKYVQGLNAALNEVADKDNKGYVISLLHKAGKDDAVVALTPFLTDEYLSEKASRALASIGSELASKALIGALPSAKGHALISVIEALGDSKYAAAESVLLPMIGNSNPDVQKVLLYSLSNIAGPASANALKNAASSVNYVYDVTNATGSYIHYISQLVGKNNALAESLANDLLKNTNSDLQVDSRIAALSILTKINGENYTKSLVKAANDKNLEYRVAALKLASPFLNQSTINDWVKGLKKADADAKADFITFLARSNNSSVVSSIQKSLKSKSGAERASAIAALSKLEGDKALPVLLNLLAKGDTTDRSAIQEAFLTMRGEQVQPLLVEALPTATAQNKVVLIEVLSHRAYPGSFSAIKGLLTDNDTAVQKAAFEALPQIVRSTDLPVLLALMNTNGDNKNVQQAIINSVENSANKDQDISSILSQYNSQNDQQKVKYLTVLSGIGGKDALEAVIETGKTNNADLKNAVILSLANWKDQSALQTLIDLSRTTTNAAQLDAIVKGLVRLTASSDITGERKLLIYRDLMEVAQTAAQKQSILRNIEATNTYNALRFAGTFLDDKELGRVAANTVMNIALLNPAYNGEDVKGLLNKVIELLSGSESGYLREAVIKHIDEMPKGAGYVSLFNGKDLSGWKGLVADPIKRSKMSESELAAAQVKADEEMRQGWIVKDGILAFTGKGNNIATVKQYGDFEMLVDWKLDKNGKDGDAGVYLRGTPQVQMWDISRTDVGAEVGSGGLYNNKENESKPSKVADNPLGDWNTMKIKMVGEKVTVHLNGELVVDNVTLENYWDRNQSIFPVEQIELQAHGTLVYYRDIFLKELPRKEIFQLNEQEKNEGFKVLFDGTNLDSWQGNTSAYVVSDEGTLAIYPTKDSGGNLYTKEEFGDFVYRFEFRLTPGANNGIGIRSPLTGDAAYVGMEIQVLDDDADMYKDLEVYQYHGSVYGILAAKRGALKPMGEWNQEEIYIKGNDIKVTLNGKVILSGNLSEAVKNGTLDKKDHPGLKRTSGHIAFLGHGSEVHFKNIRIKEL
ncbi:family 16 glycoside hydrolase [Albibacterium bauzanense]|uniref:HEAT repeat protein n=1 Tax=Albibacterium bauzanense TaxID=653929 RepID=A0A4R1LTL0_9SPHI|nr:family 16 glycoside hydrolase [Albibacterium bauzanense]TCK80599.1 HEAT repeat protein [Albibacterium bauzanense]